MNRNSRILLTLALLLVLPLSADAQIGPGPFSAFPSDDPTDGRFMAFGCAGLQTFEQSVVISLAAPAATTDFTINVFDGDTGGVDGLGRRHWDLGTRPLVFRVYADPLRTGTTAPANLIGEWFGNSVNAVSGGLWTSSAPTMPNNDWWAVTITTDASAQAPSGNYFYNFTIGTDGNCGLAEQLESSLKLAASAPMSFRTPQFGLVGGLRQVANDVPIIYPGSTSTVPATGLFVTAPTTYDGTFTFFFTLPGGELELRLYDGDFDHGTNPAELVSSPSNQPLDSCADLDDPDTDASYTGFPFSTTGATPEGAVNPGFPPDDNRFDTRRRGELGDAFRVGCVRYEVMDPEGNTYFNDNPSGSFEWEQFLIAHPSSPDAGLADGVYSGTSSSLPAGTWQVRVVGLDLSNLNFWFADTCSIRGNGTEASGACPDQSIYLLGDTVFADANGNGTQDVGDAGIAGVLMELVRVSDGALVATTRTGDTSNPNWAACVANNTGLDTDGLYCFGIDVPGAYTARVAASNFDAGEPLEGLASTTGGEEQTGTIVTTNVLTLDFGYRAGATASVGDRVWYDADGDGVQDAGENGINGVTVELLNSVGTVIGSQVTAGDGNYTFSNLDAGTYSVRVVTATLPAGLAQTHDLDGLGTANVASFTLASGDNKTDVDFGYRGTASLGDRVWLDGDGDGVQDAGENGINGVTVELLDGGGNVIATDVTAGDGEYGFGDLDAGTYSVRVVTATLPAGLAQTFDLDGLGTANIASAPLTAGQNRTDVDFGYRSTASLGDRVWLDGDGDGVQDGGENGINGVTVELLNSGGTVIGSQVTAGDGNYTFSNLDAGTYSVRVVTATLPAGLAQTFDFDGLGTANIASATLTAGQNRTDVDFGYRGTASLGDRVWLDGDGDGVQDAGENGINGVTVELLNSGGTVIGSQVTAGDGNYTFSNLDAGTYSVRVVTATLPAGLAQTFDFDGLGTANIASAPLTAGQNRTDVDFGYRGTASVGDRVWLDGDGDGVQDAGENGINGATVELLNSGGTVIGSQVTAGDGNYTFSNLDAGTYSVRVVTATLPAGLAQTFDFDGLGTANIASAPLTAGQNRTDVDFGYRGTASVGDRVWNDVDGDGSQDGGEAGLNGITVELLDGGGSVIATQVTSGDGTYTFANLSAGNYSVRVVTSTLPAGFAQTFDLDGLGTANIASAPLTAGQNRTDVDFGYRGANGSLGDRVWLDLDADGVQDGGENGINGVTVELLNGGGTVIGSQVTAGDGGYTFSNLAPGSYSVRVVTATLPAGLVQTFDLDGVGTANIAVATLAAAEDRTDVDFGYRGTGSIGDRVWYDFDGDGVQDAGETGINGVTVELVNSSGAVIATRVTAGNGNYTFSNLPAGTYTVRVVSSTLPVGLAATFDRDGIATLHTATVALTTGQNRTDVDFGYRGTGSIGDKVWRDIDADGVLDAGESGISGATVTLLDGGGNVVATRVTNSSGTYNFTNLPPGNYTVRVETATLPGGLVPTFDLDGIVTPHIALVPLALGQARTDVDFGYRGLGSLGDRVWLDLDGDGVQDPGEPGLNGVTVRLQSSGGTTLLSQVTSGDGNYLFTNLPAASYRVRVVTSTLPAGLDASYDLDGLGTLNFANVALGVSQNRTDVDFGYHGKGAIGDLVWLDYNEDGKQDFLEPGIPNVKLTLSRSGVVYAMTLTDANGFYLFEGLPGGTYMVEIDPTTLPADVVPVYDRDGVATPHKATFTLSANSVRTDIDFGYRGPTGSIGDFVWLDQDGDGIQDPLEPGLSKIKVDLFAAGSDGQFGTADDLLVAVTATDNKGFYEFVVPPGTYAVYFEVGGLTAKDQGGNDAADSDPFPATGYTAPFVLLPNQVLDTIDAGVSSIYCPGQPTKFLHPPSGPDIPWPFGGKVTATANTTLEVVPSAAGSYLRFTIVDDSQGLPTCGESVGPDAISFNLKAALTSSNTTVVAPSTFNEFRTNVTPGGDDPLGTFAYEVRRNQHNSTTFVLEIKKSGTDLKLTDFYENSEGYLWVVRINGICYNGQPENRAFSTCPAWAAGAPPR